MKIYMQLIQIDKSILNTYKSVFIFNKEDYEEYERLKSSAPNMILREAFLDIELLDKETDSSNRAGCYIMKAVDDCEKDADKRRQ